MVWADGADVGTDSDYAQTYTVASGVITLATAASHVIVGMPYNAEWKSSKLSMQGQDVNGALARAGRVNYMTLLAKWIHPKGLRYGPDSSNLNDMPEIEGGKAIDADTIRTTYTENAIEFPGTWLTDERIYLKAQAPRPCTILALVLGTSS